MNSAIVVKQLYPHLKLKTKHISKGQKTICQTGKYESRIERNLFGMFPLLSRSRKSKRSCLRYVVYHWGRQHGHLC